MKSVYELQTFLIKKLSYEDANTANKYLRRILKEHEKKQLELLERVNK